MNNKKPPAGMRLSLCARHKAEDGGLTQETLCVLCELCER
jgi:hypothetical protein